jgi:hypothetical protein
VSQLLRQLTVPLLGFTLVGGLYLTGLAWCLRASRLTVQLHNPLTLFLIGGLGAIVALGGALLAYNGAVLAQ